VPQIDHIGSGWTQEQWKVKTLSPAEDFMIAFHSPSGLVETGLFICLPEKKAIKLACEVQRDPFSSPV
jgi:hypothetical protein